MLKVYSPFRKVPNEEKKLLVIVITLLVLIVIGAAIYSNFYFTLGKSNNENNIGIIDGYLSQNEYKNLNYYNKTYVDKKTHGDQLITIKKIRLITLLCIHVLLLLVLLNKLNIKMLMCNIVLIV